MSAVELWDMGGPPVSVAPARSSQSTQNNLVGASTPPIDVLASEPPESVETQHIAATTHERGILHYETKRAR
jgi:hypothetical protein